MSTRCLGITAVVLSLGSVARSAVAQEPPPDAPTSTSTSSVEPSKSDKASLKVTPTGYAEVAYAYNFNNPSNRITNYRVFDNRHNTFTPSNVALGAGWEIAEVSGKLILQVGHTPSTYYLGEPLSAGTGSANASGPELWKYVQEARIGYKAPVGRGLLLELGIFPSPCGIEVFAVKDNWNWSRSNLFFGLPFYHTGFRATYEWSSAWSSAWYVVNGWNSVVDNNEEKSLFTTTTYKAGAVLVQAMYMGGVERPRGSPEGPYWRHHFDLFGQVDATTWLSFGAEADAGWEPNRIATAKWFAGALYARAKPFDGVYIALRGDRFHEHLGTRNGVATSPVFWGGVEWVSSFTSTLDVRPVEDHLSVRLEYRHDQADGNLYFKKDVQGDGTATTPFVPNAQGQDTLLLGATAWF